jgi:hypothetical protein
MDNANLTRQTRLRLEESEALLSELSVLHDLSRTVTGQLRQDDVVEAIHRQVARLLDVRHMVLAVIDEGAAELTAVLRLRDNVRDAEPMRRWIHARMGLMPSVATSGRPIRTEDYLGECARRGLEPVEPDRALPHWIGVPMLAGTQVVGVLALRSADRHSQRARSPIGPGRRSSPQSAGSPGPHARLRGPGAGPGSRCAAKLRALGGLRVAHDFNKTSPSLRSWVAPNSSSMGGDPTARQWLHHRGSATDAKRCVGFRSSRIRRDQPAVAVDRIDCPRGVPADRAARGSSRRGRGPLAAAVATSRPICRRPSVTRPSCAR